ncbi:PfkB family carbohydrate kinase [Motilibacter aurantiacus]|uniref:PfkB family carbohydrate kinase n=1 Tax=Motilibacter aurantiacus TaxID=2714955 RepID=UPI0014072E29|nr:carbohydrate kinase [Motilibacter aurantiacus]
MTRLDVVVVGQVGRDLVLQADAVPPAGGSEPVRVRRELLGGKGANQAVGMAQLGARVALLGVVGDDAAGSAVLDQARADGIDVTHVLRRAGAATALLVDVVAGGERRLLEDVPPGTLLTVADVSGAAQLLKAAAYVAVQLQQPADAALAAARTAVDGGARVVLDGAPQDSGATQALLATAYAVRADASEAQELTGRELPEVGDVLAAARELLGRGPRLCALGAPGGDVVAWPGGHVVLPHAEHPADTTGGGDAFVAGLTVALLRGRPEEEAAQLAAAATASTVKRLGGRPALGNV